MHCNVVTKCESIDKLNLVDESDEEVMIIIIIKTKTETLGEEVWNETRQL